MAKRFIDTEIFNDPWFMDLSVNSKLFYIYMITNCDHAGIIDINWKLAELQTGIKQLAKSYESLIKEYNNRIMHLRGGYYFIPKFITFQYPGFPKSKVRQQEGAIKRLIEFNLFDIENKSLNKELINSYEYDYVIDSGNGSVKSKEKGKEKIKHSEFVFLTEEEYNKLIAVHGGFWTGKIIEILNNYKASSGKKYKSDYHAILSWVVSKVKDSPDYAAYRTKKMKQEQQHRESLVTGLHGKVAERIPDITKIGRKVPEIEDPDKTPEFK